MTGIESVLLYGVSHSACLWQMVGGRGQEVKFGSIFCQPAGDVPHVRPCLLSIIYSRMNQEEFHKSLTGDRPPEDLNLPLAALWWDAKGDWTKAHESAQQDEGPAGAWVHAYLHRKEGDLSNAGYWYGRAGKSQARMSLDQEWAEIVNSLINEKR
jgi:hypothetical protein